MTGKLKIIRVLSNPAKRRKTAKSRTMRKNAKPRARAARSLTGKWVVRIITPTRRAAYWTGEKWSDQARAAKQFQSKAAGYQAFKKSRLKRTAWLVADIMPA